MIGTLIHYVAYDGSCLAGIIIGQAIRGYDIVIFTNMTNVNGDQNFGVQFHQKVEYRPYDDRHSGTFHYASGETGEP